MKETGVGVVGRGWGKGGEGAVSTPSGLYALCCPGLRGWGEWDENFNKDWDWVQETWVRVACRLGGRGRGTTPTRCLHALWSLRPLLSGSEGVGGGGNGTKTSARTGRRGNLKAEVLLGKSGTSARKCSHSQT